MKVDIKVTKVTKGMVFKKSFYDVKVIFQLTEEEKAIIKNRGIEVFLVMQHGKRDSVDDGLDNFITYRTLLDGTFETDFSLPIRVNNFQADLHEALQKSKEFLKANEKEPEDVSFEI